MILEKILKNNSIKILKSSKSVLLVFLIYILIGQLYLIKKNNLDFIDKWSLKNLNDWTQYNQVFLKKNDKYKDEIFSLRKCDDFILIPITSLNGELKYENYLNVVAHKSVYIVDGALLYENYYKYKLNKEKLKKINNFIKDLQNQKNLELILNSENFKNSVFLFDNIIYVKYFSNLDSKISKNFMRLSDEFVFYSNNPEIKNELRNCDIK